MIRKISFYRAACAARKSKLVPKNNDYTLNWNMQPLAAGQNCGRARGLRNQSECPHIHWVNCEFLGGGDVCHGSVQGGRNRDFLCGLSGHAGWAGGPEAKSRYSLRRVL